MIQTGCCLCLHPRVLGHIVLIYSLTLTDLACTLLPHWPTPVKVNSSSLIGGDEKSHSPSPSPPPTPVAAEITSVDADVAQLPAHDDHSAKALPPLLPDTGTPAHGVAEHSVPMVDIEPVVEDRNTNVAASGDIGLQSLMWDVLRFHVEDVDEGDRWDLPRLLNKALHRYINVHNNGPKAPLGHSKRTPAPTSWSGTTWQKHGWQSHQGSAEWQGGSWNSNAIDASHQWGHSDWKTSCQGWKRPPPALPKQRRRGQSPDQRPTPLSTSASTSSPTSASLASASRWGAT